MTQERRQQIDQFYRLKTTCSYLEGEEEESYLAVRDSREEGALIKND
jgi:hypothetical protein